MATRARDRGWHDLQMQMACLAGEPTRVKLCSVSGSDLQRRFSSALTMFNHAVNATNRWYRVCVERLWVEDVGRHSLQTDLAL